MSIFDKIKSAIWGDDTEVAPEARPADRLPGNATLSTGIAPESEVCVAHSCFVGAGAC